MGQVCRRRLRLLATLVAVALEPKPLLTTVATVWSSGAGEGRLTQVGRLAIPITGVLHNGLTMPTEVPPCIFEHKAPSVVRFELSEGCACFPDKLQDRCAQHAYDLLSNVSYSGTCDIVIQYFPDTPWPWRRD